MSGEILCGGSRFRIETVRCGGDAGVAARYRDMPMRRTVFNGRRPDVFLPDGRCVAHVRLGDLYRALTALGVPGIRSDMPKFELVAVYAEHVGAPVVPEMLAPGLRGPVYGLPQDGG